jgi:hypothetical protein
VTIFAWSHWSGLRKNEYDKIRRRRRRGGEENRRRDEIDGTVKTR